MSTRVVILRSVLLLLILAFQNSAHGDVGRTGCLSSRSTDSSVGLRSPISDSDREMVSAFLSEVISVLEFDIHPEIEFSPAGSFGALSPRCSDATFGAIIVGGEELDALKGGTALGTQLVLAHEYGHIIQYHVSPELAMQVCDQSVSDIRTIELIADFVAGYVMRKILNRSDATPLLAVIGALGDYNFSQSDHHGQVNERMNAFNFGQMVAFREWELDMNKLLANRATFLKLLDGPSRNQIRRPEDAPRWFDSAIEELYQ